MRRFLKFIFEIELYMFQTGFLSITRCIILYVVYPLLCLQYLTPYDGQKSCPCHVESYSKNKFEKLVHLVGSIIKKFCHIHYQHNELPFWAVRRH
jgi:hypothetical protein